jgi:hypothetical protein
MRINAERERIQIFKDIAGESAKVYYRILKKITEENALNEKEKQANSSGV